MEMSRMLLICTVLVASVYAGQMKSMKVELFDLCEKYIHTDPSEYAHCGEQDDNGKELCYLNKTDHVKCDSVKDCPHFGDEKGCKAEHEKYCATGFDGKPGLTPHRCAPFSTENGFPEGDVMCIPNTGVCNGKVDCPQGDDEANCPPQ